METGFLSNDIDRLIGVTISLTAKQDISELLKDVVFEARALTNADAGSLYVLENDELIFCVSQNETIEKAKGTGSTEELFQPFPIPLTEKSLAGHVAMSGELLCFEDVYDLPEGVAYRFNDEYDKRVGYKTQSMLLVPMRNPDGRILGVLQLINAMSFGKIIPFTDRKKGISLALASAAAVALANAQLRENLKQANSEIIFRLSVAAEYRDKDTLQHIMRVAHYSKALALELGWSKEDAQMLFDASPMHDVGKIGIPDEVLKKPDRLTDDEFKIIQSHSQMGADILKNPKSEILELARDVAIFHHEKWDGSGYPNGVAGEDIPMSGRIVAVADVYDALSAERCYKDPMPREKVLSIMREGAGTHFDAEVIDAFFSIEDEFIEIAKKYAEIKAGD